MSRAPDKKAFELTKNGYLMSYKGYTDSMYYGYIVCHALNKWYGMPETPQYLKDAPSKSKKLHEAIHKAVTSSYNKFPALVELKDPRLKNLRKIVTDRDSYILEYGRLTAQFSSKVIEVQLFWDGERKQVIQRMYTDDIDDLLLYDIAKVLERGIVIRQCPYNECGRYFVVGKGGRKYCSEHGKAGANQTRYRNRRDDECKTLYYKIYNRLLATSAERFEKFCSEYNQLIALESSRKITEEEKLARLHELDDKYRQRKKYKPRKKRGS